MQLEDQNCMQRAKNPAIHGLVNRLCNDLLGIHSLCAPCIVPLWSPRANRIAMAGLARISAM